MNALFLQIHIILYEKFPKYSYICNKNLFLFQRFKELVTFFVWTEEKKKKRKICKKILFYFLIILIKYSALVLFVAMRVIIKKQM